MPSIYSIKLSGADFGQVQRSHVHAVLSGLLGHATNLWSLLSLPEHEVGTGEMRIGLLADSLESDLAETLSIGTSLRFEGKRETQVATVLADPLLIQRTTWGELATPFISGKMGNKWDVTFQSPTSISLGDHNFPLLAADELLVSLLKRWARLEDVRRAASEVELGKSPVLELNLFALSRRRWEHQDFRQLRVTDLRGHTEVEFIPRRSQTQTPGGGVLRAAKVTYEVIPGFVGIIRLLALNREVAALTDCLLRFAEYAGVGAGVRYGLGSLKVDLCPPRS